MTPLLAACQNGHTATVELLLAKGADAEAKNEVDPLFKALETIRYDAICIGIELYSSTVRESAPDQL